MQRGVRSRGQRCSSACPEVGMPRSTRHGAGSGLPHSLLSTSIRRVLGLLRHRNTTHPVKSTLPTAKLEFCGDAFGKMAAPRRTSEPKLQRQILDRFGPRHEKCGGSRICLPVVS